MGAWLPIILELEYQGFDHVDEYTCCHGQLYGIVGESEVNAIQDHRHYCIRHPTHKFHPLLVRNLGIENPRVQWNRPDRVDPIITLAVPKLERVSEPNGSIKHGYVVP